MPHGNAGRKQSPEQIAKRVATTAATKAKWSEEKRAEISARVSANNPQKDPEVRAKNAAAHLGKQAPNKGKSLPSIQGENHWAKRAKAEGKPVFSDETLEKMRAAKLGKAQSPESVAKRSANMIGHRHSEETKEKIRATNKETWSKPEVKEKVTGPNSPTWKGGLVPYPPGWTESLREWVRTRDSRVCQHCGVSEAELPTKLVVHHKDHNKDNLAEDNLIAVCRSCHGTIHNREGVPLPKRGGNYEKPARKPMSEKQRLEVGKFFKGRKQSPEHIAKRMAATHTPERTEQYAERIRLRNLENNPAKSDDARKKNSDWHKGRKQSPETIAKRFAWRTQEITV